MGLGGGAPETKQVGKFLPEQDALLKDVISAIEPFIGQPATEIPFETFAEAPAQLGEAAERFPQAREAFAGDIEGALRAQLSGEPLSPFDPTEIASIWEKSLATPIMRQFELEDASRIRESMATGLFSTSTEQTVQRGRESLKASVLAPLLFQGQLAGMQIGAASKESAAGRQAGAITTATNLPLLQFQQDLVVSQAIQQENQKKLLDEYQRFIRMTPEASPWLQLGMQAAGLGSESRLDTIATSGGDGLGILGGAGTGALLGLALAAPTGGLSLTTGTLLGAGFGAAAGSGF